MGRSYIIMNFPRGLGINGIISEKADNLALIYAPEGMKAAGVFTSNKLKAHPVIHSQKIISGDLHRAVLVSKGSANVATGEKGKRKLEALIKDFSSKTSLPPSMLLTASTGVIGSQMEYSSRDLDFLCRKKTEVEPLAFARAIMTTDTVEKTAAASCEIEEETVNIYGVAKGSGMISPKLATMLAFVMTDCCISKKMIDRALKKVAKESFNCLIIDGETSTNDSVFLLSSSKASNKIIDRENADYNKFCSCLKKVCISLVKDLARDGEGASKMIKIKVSGAESNEDASAAARAVASSPLCKTAFYGASPNWGRIASAIGAVGIDIDIEKLTIYAGEVKWLENGMPASSSPKLQEVLNRPEYELKVIMGKGPGKAYVYTCDYSPEYVNINANYLS